MTGSLKKWFIFVWLLVFPLQVNIYAQSLDTPVLLQVATFTKVFKYDAALGHIDPSVLIVYTGESRTIKNELVRAFKDASIKADATTLNELNAIIKKYDVIYLMPGAKSASALCKQYKKLSISGLSTYAEEGYASIALGLVNDKPRLFVNLKSLQQEGHTLSAKLLQVVRVF